MKSTLMLSIVTICLNIMLMSYVSCVSRDKGFKEGKWSGCYGTLINIYGSKIPIESVNRLSDKLCGKSP